MAKIFQVDTGGTLTNNLQAYYKLEDANDFFSTNNLTNNGAATFVAGKVINAVHLVRAASQSLNQTANALGYTGGAYSIAGWVKLASQPGGNFYSLGTVSLINNSYFWLSYNNGNLTAWRTKPSVGNEGPVVAQVLNTGTYYHWAITYDGTNVRSYINGSLVGGPTAASGTAGGGNSSSAIGAASIGDNLMDGDIDEVGFWSKALSAQELTDLYNGGNGQTMLNQATGGRMLMGIG